MLPSNSRVVFIGDSITDAFRKPEEINDAFQLGAGYAFLVAARLRAENPDKNFLFWNRGISGHGVRDLAARWDEDVLAHKPTLVSILVGVNETLRGQNGNLTLSTDEYELELRSLLCRTRAALPDVRLVLCEPFLLPVAGIASAALADLQSRAARVEPLARELAATCVPLGAMFRAAQNHAPAEFWAYDGVHPTAAGQFLVAQKWLEVVAG